MNMENPIKKVRAAVTARAGQLAEKDFNDKPQKEHFSQAFAEFRAAKEDNPKVYEQLVETFAATKELNDEMGPELAKVYQEVSEEISQRNVKKVGEAVHAFLHKDLEGDEYDKEMKAMFTRISNKLTAEVENDPRILKAFKEKSELLKKVLEATKKIFPEMLSTVLQVS